MANNGPLRGKIVAHFRHNGLTLRTEATDYLVETLSALDDEQREVWLGKISDFSINKLDVETIEKSHIHSAIVNTCKNEIDDEEELIEVISAFDVPRFTYSNDKKKFFAAPHEEHRLLPEPVLKGSLFVERYNILHQLISRNPLFSRSRDNAFKLSSVEILLSTDLDVENVLILGMLSQFKEGQYYLEDPTGSVPIDLTDTNYHDGFFCETCFVLVEGHYKDQVLLVDSLGLPPREPSDTSRIFFGTLNTFGGESKFSLRDSERLKRLEQMNQDALIVILSDVWLDDPKVQEKLEVLFQGYSDCPPIAFVMMGNFVSSQDKGSHRELFKDGFDVLLDLVKPHQRILSKSKFIIIPGPTDCHLPNILPRPQIPEFMVGNFKNTVENVILATNPARIRYCTQELLFIREDLVTKMCRNCIHFPESRDIGFHFAKTIVCGAHLVPLPPNVCPLYWDYDPALQLYPCPDVIVVGDQQPTFNQKLGDCQVINTGSFSKTFMFKVYSPATREIEDCELPEEE